MTMTRFDSNPERPAVSVIVPARNEAQCLSLCLQSLVAQAGLSFEVIVVDDASADRTRQIALSFPGVHLVDAGPVPEGWTGKNNAMASGARVAQGEWLLFTDADTVHLPHSLARSVAEAQQRGAALLSYSPEQEVHGIWEKAVMPVIFAELAGAYRPSEVSNPNSSAAAANGQYLLISREAYDAVGGHAAVASSLLEDVALARAVKGSGRTILFRYGGDAVRARMYRSFAQLREGWTKNLALLFPSPGRLALLRLAEFMLIIGSAQAAIFAALRQRTLPAVAAAVLFLVLCPVFVARIRQAHFASGATIWSLLGLPLFSYLLLRSRRSFERNRVSWKGRTYGALSPPPARTAWMGTRASRDARKAAGGQVTESGARR
jgi:glycosyltransferase involved in cell wall biosynthesis